MYQETRHLTRPHAVKTDWLNDQKIGCLDASETTSLNWLLESKK